MGCVPTPFGGQPAARVRPTPPAPLCSHASAVPSPPRARVGIPPGPGDIGLAPCGPQELRSPRSAKGRAQGAQQAPREVLPPGAACVGTTPPRRLVTSSFGQSRAPPNWPTQLGSIAAANAGSQRRNGLQVRKRRGQVRAGRGWPSSSQGRRRARARRTDDRRAIAVSLLKSRSHRGSAAEVGRPARCRAHTAAAGQHGRASPGARGGGDPPGALPPSSLGGIAPNLPSRLSALGHCRGRTSTQARRLVLPGVRDRGAPLSR